MDCTDSSYYCDEKSFGPFLQLFRCPDFKASLQLANCTQYGPAAGLLCTDKKIFEQFYAEIKAGIIIWNRPTTGASSKALFGEIGRSGNFRPTAFYAADYWAYPVASQLSEQLDDLGVLPPGYRINIK